MASAATGPREFPPGTLLAGRYRLLRIIGQGGVGAVYEAEIPSGEKVAVKVLSADIEGPSQLARFIREANISASLPDPHVVPVLNGAIDPETHTPFLVMPLLHGENLDDLLNRTGALDPELAVRLALHAAAGLQTAHDFGIVHRDVKPSNVFLDTEGEEITAKVCDFGIAKIKPVDEQSITRTGTLLGSPMYMSPEQLMNPRNVDPRADVWGLGMTLYHALAGQPAFAGARSFSDLVVALTSDEPPSLQAAAPWVEPGLARAVHGALLRDPEARCPSIEALVESLRPYAGVTLAVTRSMLVGISPARRAERAVLALLPSAWHAVDSTQFAPTVRVDPYVGEVIGGRYELLHCIGKGPLGAVYAARSAAHGPCAVKLLRPHVFGRSARARERFLARMKLAAELRSEHSARVLEAGFDKRTERPFVAMELLQGRDLAQTLRERAGLEPGAACRTFLQASEGLAEAHAAGLVHYNIKPSNLFLHELPSGQIVTKLTDFAVLEPPQLRPDDAGVPESAPLTLSPLYMSPEQASLEGAIDHRTDIYSLAVSLYEALCNQKPWQGFSSLGEMMLTVGSEDIRPLRELAPSVDQALADAVHGGLQHDPGRRTGTAREFAEALGPHGDGVPTLTRAVLTGLPGRAPTGPSTTRLKAAVDLPDAPKADDPHDPRPSAPPPAVLRSERPPRFLAPPDPPPVPIGAILAILALAGSIAGGLYVWQAGAARGASPAPPPASSGRKLVATLRVSPLDARVTVNHAPARRDAQGSVLLEGDPGEAFDVVAEKGELRVEKTILLTKHGEAFPDRFDLTGPSPTPGR